MSQPISQGLDARLREELARLRNQRAQLAEALQQTEGRVTQFRTQLTAIVGAVAALEHLASADPMDGAPAAQPGGDQPSTEAPAAPEPGDNNPETD